MEIEHIIKEANNSAQKQPQQIQQLIQLLSREYAVRMNRRTGAQGEREDARTVQRMHRVVAAD